MNIIIGSAQFGLDYGISNRNGIVSNKKIKNIIDLAAKNGISEIDTAVNYGSSHAAIGGVEHSLEISSKLPEINLDEDDISDQIFKIFSKSLQELNKSKLKTLYLHSPQQLLQPNGKFIYESLLTLKSQKLIKNIGISVYDPNEVLEIIRNFDIDVVQLPFNLIDQRFNEKHLLEKLKEKKIEVNCRSIFLQGLLLMPLHDLPKQFEKWQGLFLSWTNWLKVNQIHPVHACIAFAAMNQNIDNIVVGIESLVQLEQIISFFSKNNFSELSFPNIKSDDSTLVNPSFWSKG
ncbi:aldo/keto reductase [Gammaproteobacteria bacterium]|nr:aldo/keto reductase [Gammaproteobacteria bacterium]